MISQHYTTYIKSILIYKNERSVYSLTLSHVYYGVGLHIVVDNQTDEEIYESDGWIQRKYGQSHDVSSEEPVESFDHCNHVCRLSTVHVCHCVIKLTTGE